MTTTTEGVSLEEWLRSFGPITLKRHRWTKRVEATAAYPQMGCTISAYGMDVEEAMRNLLREMNLAGDDEDEDEGSGATSGEDEQHTE